MGRRCKEVREEVTRTVQARRRVRGSAAGASYAGSASPAIFHPLRVARFTHPDTPGANTNSHALIGRRVGIEAGVTIGSQGSSAVPGSMASRVMPGLMRLTL